MDAVCSLFLTQILEIILDFSLSHPKTNPVVSFFKTFHHCKPFFRTNVVQALSWVSASTLAPKPCYSYNNHCGLYEYKQIHNTPLFSTLQLP